MHALKAFNLKKWINEHRESLKPPVCNIVIWEDAEIIVMVVGGPNSRQDYHVNDEQEIFYQIEGDIILKVIDEGKQVDIPIKHGDMFMLPSRMPHSPQRPANSVGLVIEHKRVEKTLDGFQWYCEKCHHKLYEEFLPITDLVKQLPQIFERFYSKEENRCCKKCGWIMPIPEKQGKK